jgi:hypothetical protein
MGHSDVLLVLLSPRSFSERFWAGARPVHPILGLEYLICCSAIPAYIASRDAQPGGDNVTGIGSGGLKATTQLIVPRCAVVVRRTRSIDVDLAGQHFFKKSASK